MLPIFALSVWAVFIFFDKFLQIRKYLADAETGDTPVSNIIRHGRKFRHLPAAELRAIMENAANEETSKMESCLPKLNTCAVLAPMIGFLGTVVGMIQAFYDMAQAGNNVSVELLSRGIYTALITTVAGLIVGITASLLGSLLGSLIDKVVARMESACNRFIEDQYKLTE